jgi:hypothetical protein
MHRLTLQHALKQGFHLFGDWQERHHADFGAEALHHTAHDFSLGTEGLVQKIAPK